MKLKIDQQADVLYLTLRDEPASLSEEVAHGIIADYDLQDRAVGIELHQLSRWIPDLGQRLLIEFVPAID